MLVPQEEARVPMMARAANDECYLLGFKNVFSARRFAQSSAPQAEPRMIVPGNKQEFIGIAQSAGAVGVLVDYDPSTNAYASAAELF